MAEEDEVPVSGVVAGTGVTLSTEKEDIRGCGRWGIFQDSHIKFPTTRCHVNIPLPKSEVYVPSS